MIVALNDARHASASGRATDLNTSSCVVAGAPTKSKVNALLSADPLTFSSMRLPSATVTACTPSAGRARARLDVLGELGAEPDGLGVLGLGVSGGGAAASRGAPGRSAWAARPGGGLEDSIFECACVEAAGASKFYSTAAGS